MWVKVRSSKWVNDKKNIIIRYRMAGNYEFLRYEKESDLEYGDFKSFTSLKKAKAFSHYR